MSPTPTKTGLRITSVGTPTRSPRHSCRSAFSICFKDRPWLGEKIIQNLPNINCIRLCRSVRSISWSLPLPAISNHHGASHGSARCRSGQRSMACLQRAGSQHDMEKLRSRSAHSKGGVPDNSGEAKPSVLLSREGDTSLFAKKLLSSCGGQVTRGDACHEVSQAAIGGGGLIEQGIHGRPLRQLELQDPATLQKHPTARERTMGCFANEAAQGDVTLARRKPLPDRPFDPLRLKLRYS